MAGDLVLLEYDRGTDNHDQVENKIDRYRLVGRTGRAEDALLFVSPNPIGSAKRGTRSSAQLLPSPQLYDAAQPSTTRLGRCGFPFITTDAG